MNVGAGVSGGSGASVEAGNEEIAGTVGTEGTEGTVAFAGVRVSSTTGVGSAVTVSLQATANRAMARTTVEIVIRLVVKGMMSDM